MGCRRVRVNKNTKLTQKHSLNGFNYCQKRFEDGRNFMMTGELN